MPILKIASWNIYFSHEFVRKNNSGQFTITSTQETRANQVADHIAAIDPHVLGIIECMPIDELEYFRDIYFPGYECVIEGSGKRLNLGMLYWPDDVTVEKVNFDKERWTDKLYHNRPERIYKWTRVPLMVKITHNTSGNEFIVALVHPKSKKTYSRDPGQARAEALRNRERIVAEGRRLHKLLWEKAEAHGEPFNRFIVMGDINDGPWFDRYESKVLRSGVESHIGSVFDPDQVLHSFVDLSNEKGHPTTPFGGGKQLDHILYTHDFDHGTTKPKVVPSSGKIRDDLVNFDNGSGKRVDSDHCPVEIQVRV